MLNLKVNFALVETLYTPVSEIIEPLTVPVPVLPPEPQSQLSKQAIRTSLKASTIDGVFAAIFTSITTGVLLTDFLLHLGASPVEIGMLSSIPMLLNLLQPLGAYFADRTTSRHNYCLWIFGISRLLWLILVVGIGWVSWSTNHPHRLVSWTLAMVFATNILNALGSSAWVSWMASLVPHRLRGRYFGFRNSAGSLTTLLSVPLLGFAVSAWPTGTMQGYSIVLFLGVVAGLVSMACQFFMIDVNPQVQLRSKGQQGVSRNYEGGLSAGKIDLEAEEKSSLMPFTFGLSPNFLRFLFYFGLWTFAINLSSPFFNLYLLDNLGLDLGWVTLYTSLGSGANLVTLVLWGKLADRIGNRPLLLLVGIVVAVTPLFWLGTGNESLSLWVWLPLIHLLSGGTWAAVELCSSNIQMEVAPMESASKYFALAAAVAGVCGAFGTTAGGFLAQLADVGGLPGLFALSSVVRLIALLPLIFVREPRSQSVVHLIQNLFDLKSKLVPVPAAIITDPAEQLAKIS